MSDYSRWLQKSYAGGTFNSRVLRDAVTARIGSPPKTPLLPPIGGALLDRKSVV